MKSSAPILRCGGWGSLIAALAERPELRGLGALRPATASAVLAAPAAVARWIALAAPSLAGRDALSILVIGAESTDAPDQGRWYQTIPAMLDAAIEVRATLVGAELDTTFASAAAGQAPSLPADCAHKELAEFLGARAPGKFDLAAVFQPGFQKHRRWLEDAGFARLLAAGTRVMGSSNAPDEYQMERWVLECYGYRVSNEPVANPFFLDLGDARSSIRWGSALWDIESAPPPGFRTDEGRLAELDTLTRMVMHSITVVREPSPAPGALDTLQASDGGSRQVIHVFDRRFVDRGDGSLLQLKENGELEAIGRLPAAELARYPGEQAREIERAVWAAAIKARYLLATYPRRADAAEAAAVAHAMYQAMRERALDLFR